MQNQLNDEDLGAIKKIVSAQLHTLRSSLDAIEADGKMTDPLLEAIYRECDRLNSLDTRINDAMHG